MKRRTIVGFVAALLFTVTAFAQQIATQGSAGGDPDAPPPFSRSAAAGLPDPSAPTVWGSFPYSIPFVVPRFQGIEPKLELRYQSGSGDGEAGAGWHLDISRVELRTEGKGIAVDPGPVVPLLNGQFLRPCAALPAAKDVPGCHFPSDVATEQFYFAEQDAGQRIAFDSAPWAGDPLNPNEGWVAVTQNGVRYDHRARRSTSPLLPPFEYLLTTVTGRLGNQVRYHYTPAGDPYRYLAGVTYNGVKVTLFWEPRPDVHFSAHGHPAIAQMRYRLRTVLIEACLGPNAYETVRVYALTYTASGTTGESLLRSVQEIGADAAVDRSTGTILNLAAATKKAPFLFEYQSEKDYPRRKDDPDPLPPGSVTAPTAMPGFAQEPIATAYVDMGVSSAASLHPGLLFQGAQVNVSSLPERVWRYGEHVEHLKGDFDGDGIDDHVIAAVVDSAIDFRCFLGAGDAYGEFPCLDSGSVLNTGTSGFNTLLQVADMTGDGRADIVVSYGTSKQLLAYNDVAHRFDRRDIGFPQAGWRDLQTGCSSNLTLAGDVNGDGLGDLVTARNVGGIYTLTSGLSDGEKRTYQTNDTKTNWFWSPRDRVLLADVDGDGRKDVVVIGSNRRATPPPPPDAGAKRFVPVCLRRYSERIPDPDRPNGSPIDENNAPPNDSALRICVALADFGPVSGINPPFRNLSCMDDNTVLWKEYPAPSPTPPPENETHGQWFAADVNGDGREDIVSIVSLTGTGASRITAYVARGGGSFRKQASADIPLAGPSSYFSSWSPLDIDGDHRTDFVRIVEGFGFQTISSRGTPGSLNVRFDTTPVLTGAPSFPFGNVVKSCWVSWPTGTLNQCRDDGLRSADFAADGKGNYRVVAWGFDGAGQARHAAGTPCDDAGTSNRGCFQYDVVWKAQALALPTPVADSTRWLTLDVDGDGYLDRVAVTARGTADLTIHTRLRNRAGGWRSADGALAGTATYSPLSARAGDFDGDGRDDLAFIRGGADTTILLARFDGATNEWKAFGSEKRFALSTVADAAAWHVADQNGDGFDDVIYAWSVADVAAGRPDRIDWRTYLSDGMGRLSLLGGSFATFTLKRLAFPFQVADVDNDGASDLVSVYDIVDLADWADGQRVLVLHSDRSGRFAFHNGRAAGGRNLQHNPAMWSVVDANGDGASDLAYVSLRSRGADTQDAWVDVLVSSGLDVFPSWTDERVTENQPLGAYRFVDANGDGRTELVQYAFDDDPTGRPVVDLGVNCFPLPRPRGYPQEPLLTTSIPAAASFPIYADMASLDIDRDTWTDLEQVIAEGDRFRVSGLFQRAAYNVISKARNPFGGVTRVVYETLASQERASGAGCIVPPFGALVVSTTDTDSRDFGAGKATVGTQRSFDYECARWSAPRRELHGFTSVVQNEKQLLSDGTTTSFPNREAATVTTSYDLSDACGARMLREVAAAAKGGARSETSSAFPAITPGELPPFDCRSTSRTRKRTEAGAATEIVANDTYTRDLFGEIEWLEQSGDASSSGDERTFRIVRTIDANPATRVSKGYVVTVAREEIFEGTKSAALADPGKQRIRAAYSCYDDPVAFDVVRPAATTVSKCRPSASLSSPQGLRTAKLQCIDLKSGKCPNDLSADFTIGATVAGKRVDYLAVTTYGYDAAGNIVEEADPRGSMVTTAYDDPFPRSIYPSQVTDAVGHKMLLQWDWAKGLLREEREPERNTRTVYAYDPLGRLTSRKSVVAGAMGDEDHVVTTFEYHIPDPPVPSQQFVKTTAADQTADGRSVLQRLDGLGRVVRTESESSPDPLSGAAVVAVQDTVYSDDSASPYLLTDIYPLGGAPKTETFVYDYLGRNTERRRASHPVHGAVTVSTRYGIEAGTTRLLTTRVTDEASHVVTTAADVYGRPVRRDEPGKTAGSVVSSRFSYDAADGLLTSRGPAGDPTTYESDGLGDIVRQIDPDRGETRFSHDAAGNVTGVEDANGVIIAQTYDAIGRVATRSESKTKRTLSFFYDDKGASHGAGNAGWGFLTLVRDSAAAACPGGDPMAGVDPIAFSFGYDLLGRPVQTDKCWSGVTKTSRVSYDRFGRLFTVTYPDATPEVVEYGYDAGGRVNHVANRAGNVYAENIRYDAAGRLRGTDYGNGVTEREQYDNAWGLLDKTSLRENGAAADLHDATYSYSKDRLVAGVSVDGSLYPSHSLMYVYDGQHRITAKTGFKDESFAYDDLGNLISSGAATFTFPTPGAGVKRIHALSAATIGPATYNFSYDSVGNLLEIAEPRGKRTLTWDGFNHLRGVSVGGMDTSFAYDALGERIEKTAAGETRLYFAPTFELSRKGASDTLIKYYWAGGRLLARRDGEGTTAPLRFYHHDFLGSTIALTDAMGKSVSGSEYRYLAYGALADARKPEEARGVLYTGARHDFETAPASSGEELVYLGSRYYLPAFGRFISADPIIPHTDVMGLNRYAYASGNPISRRDPNGNEDIPAPEREGQTMTVDGESLIAVRDGADLVWASRSIIYEKVDETNQSAADPQDTGFFSGFFGALREFLTTQEGRQAILQAATMASAVHGDANPVSMNLYGYQIAESRADVFTIIGVETDLGHFLPSAPQSRLGKAGKLAAEHAGGEFYLIAGGSADRGPYIGYLAGGGGHASIFSGAYVYESTYSLVGGHHSETLQIFSVGVPYSPVGVGVGAFRDEKGNGGAFQYYEFGSRWFLKFVIGVGAAPPSRAE